MRNANSEKYQRKRNVQRDKWKMYGKQNNIGWKKKT